MLGRRKLSLKKSAQINQKRPRWLRNTAAAFGVLILIAFWKEIWLLIQSTWRILSVFLQPVLFTPLPGAGVAFLVVLENAVMFALFLFGSLWLASQFVLPVHTPDERASVFQRLQVYIQGYHGAALFVKEGQEKGSKEEMRKGGPGVVFVDHSSAVVLEKQPGTYYPSTFFGQLRSLLERARHPATHLEVRAEGPGVIFTDGGERIRGTVDLRKQIRLQHDVHAYTRDGIEMLTRIITIFTLGQNPDVVRVGYVGPNAEDLRVIHLKDEYLEASEDEPRVRATVIQDLVDGIDGDDRMEVFRFWHSARSAGIMITNPPAALRVDHSPFIFDEDRVKAAVYSQARNLEEEAVSPWTDLPPQVGTEIFRDLLLQNNYDDWFVTEGDQQAKIRQLKGRFSQIMRNMGVLSYQLVERPDGEPFEVGQVWAESQLSFYPEQPFRSRKVLRDRGIKVLGATFTELEPLNKAVREEMLNNWQANWHKEAQMTRSQYELKAIKAKNQARARAEREMVRTLAGIIKDPRYTQDVLAIRVLQALEAFAADAATRRLLPHDTVNILLTLGSWIRPDLGPGSGPNEPYPPPFNPDQPH